MVAYLVKAVFPEHSEQTFSMIVYNNGSKKDVETNVRGDGWRVKRVSMATAADLTEVSPYPQVIRQVKEQAALRRKADAEATRGADAEAERRVKQLAAIEAAHQRAQEESRRYAISKATGDLLSYRLESALFGNTRIASICA
jgi:regulator of protease activity HflC (stomatin/prohibitin superfamily)